MDPALPLPQPSMDPQIPQCSTLAILAHLDSLPQYAHLGLNGFNQLLDLFKLHWPLIGPLSELPQYISTALRAFFQLSEQHMAELWNILRPLVAREISLGTPIPGVDICRIYAPSLSARIIVPPVNQCLTHSCKGRRLGQELLMEARLFSLQGVFPITSKSTYCSTCNTRYYPDFYVKDAKKQTAIRQYYSPEIKQYYNPGFNNVLHVHESVFVESDLCIYFERHFVNAHTSSKDLARVYNEAQLGSAFIARHVTLIQELSGEVVLDSFYLHALLRYAKACCEVLALPHHGEQRLRYNAALKQRNFRMAGTGQEMWSHACRKCTKYWVDADGNHMYLSACVTDGVTLGHTCCSVTDCLESLHSVRDKFCPKHANLNTQCAVNECSLEKEENYITCSTPAHRRWETHHIPKRKAKVNLERAKRSRREGSRVDQGEDQQYTDDESNPSEIKVKGRRYRRWTHNEQLVVRCCGIIISRATFFGSEGVSGVKDFLKVTFPPCYPSSMPSYIFYDNACRLLAHLRATDDHYFDDCGLPVDAFHAKSHHLKDTFCQQNCLPGLFPELKDPNGKWIFNSSAAEQANAWFGAFQSMTREMSGERYTFFLDEMIALRNQSITVHLEEQGNLPHLVPESSLRRPRNM